MMNFKKIILTAWLVAATVISFAGKVEPAAAEKAGKSYYFKSYSEYHHVSLKDISVTGMYTYESEGVADCYVFSMNTGGFIIVSADDAAWPVIGYSFSSVFDPENQPENFRWWMEKIQLQVSTARSMKLLPDAKTSAAWEFYLNASEEQLVPDKDKDVAALITSTWDQGKYYNQLCPVASGGPDGRALVGCVATAMGQVMYYYRYPVQGQNSHGGINFGTTTYRWNEMINSLGDYNYGVAQLLYHCGKSVDMSYSATGSGAMTGDAEFSLRYYFRYSNAISYDQKWIYSQSSWENLLKTDLDAGRPVIYQGTDDVNGGHAWVCDGYQNSNYFHMNWGWSGYSNGYYYLDNLTAGGYDFDQNQGCVNHIYPATGFPYGCTGTTTITYAQGSVEDGSGAIADYQNNADCSWLIAPADSVRKIILRFVRLDTEAGNDIVTVYDGATTSDPVLGTYSGNTLPAAITSTGNKMLIRFTTNGSGVAGGWLAEFDCLFPTYCSGVTTMTTASGNIDDGSGNEEYTYNATCRWRLWPANAGAITLGFTSFNLANDDFVKVYDEETGDEVANYTGTSLPQVHTYNTSKVMVYFKSNGYDNAPGFEAYYNSSPLSVDETSLSRAMLIYPNPVKDKIFISFAPDQTVVDVSIFSITGMLIENHTSLPVSTDAVVIDAAALQKGMYLVRIRQGDTDFFGKFVKE